MDIERCREFLELARCLNFTKAAKKLNMTQPALSKHISSLEQDLGATLIDRSQHNMQLTEAGRVFFENASRIVETYDHTKLEIKKLHDKLNIHVAGHLNDADVSTTISLASAIARDEKKMTVIFDRVSADPFELLANGAADVFAGYTTPKRVEKAGLVAIPLFSTQLIAVVSPSHPFAKQKNVDWSDLSNQTLVKFVSESTSPAWEQIEFACEQHGFRPKIRTISGSNNIEFFSTPLYNDVLVWKNTDRELGALLNAGQLSGISIAGENNHLTTYLVYRAEDKKRLCPFLEAVEKAKKLLGERHNRRAPWQGNTSSSSKTDKLSE